MLNGRDASAGGKVSVQDSADASGGDSAPGSEWAPPAERVTADFAAASRLARALRGTMSRAQHVCRLRRTAADVTLVEYSGDAGARLGLSGVSSCKHRMCPYCAPKWQRTRTDEVRDAISNWGPARSYFVTLTMRHHRGLPLPLLYRLLRDAWGHLWSGRGGQEAAASIGGRPESVRAMDQTWSEEHGWHPHIHGVIFAQREGTSDEELAEVLHERWTGGLRAALKRFRRLCKRILGGTPCRVVDCPVCTGAKDGAALTPAELREHDLLVATTRRRGEPCGVVNCRLCSGEREIREFPDECPHYRERATRVFGTKLIPRRLPLRESVRRVSIALRKFSLESIAPSRERAVRVERIGSAEEVSKYLPKLMGDEFFSKVGLELAGAGKVGKLRGDGLWHYSLWDVALLAADRRNPLKEHARSAWKAQFWATRGMQAITFSDRVALGLDADPYADGNEPPEAAADEVSRAVGAVAGRAWDRETDTRGHDLLIELANAHRRGVLAAVPYVTTLAPIHGDPIARPPPPRGPPPEERERRRAERRIEAERRGARIFGGALRNLTADHVDRSVFREEMRYTLRALLGLPLDRRERVAARNGTSIGGADAQVEPGVKGV